MTNSQTRYYFIDALRGFSMLLVVLGHAGVSYMPSPMHDLLWVVYDPQRHSFFDWLAWWALGTAMPIFFFIAGFSCTTLYEKKGAQGFLVNRAKRILVPFLVGLFLLLPVTFFVWCYGWLVSGQCDLSQILRSSFPPEIERNFYGPIHLWFLEYLLLLYLATFIFKRLNQPPKIKMVSSALAGALVLIVLNAFILSFHMDAFSNFHNSFIPNLFKLLYYAVFFFGGIFFYERRDRFEKFLRWGPLYFALSSAVFIPMGILLQKYFAGNIRGGESWLLGGCISLFSWLSVFGFLALFGYFFSRKNVVISFLADASYWIYLCHLPVIGFMQTTFFQTTLPVFVKFFVTTLTALAFGLLSYQVLVRHTLIGASLGGAKANKGVIPRGYFSFKFKCALSAICLVVIAVSGISVQRLYNEEKKKVRGIIAGFYHQYFNREPDRDGLEYWTTGALDRWGIKKVEVDGFIDAPERIKKGKSQ